MFVKIGPLTKRNWRSPVLLFSSRTSVPVMSDGIRSGVNCTRLNPRSRTCESVEMRSVLARPGTPISSAWPFAKTAISTSVTMSAWPMTTCEMFSMSAR